MVVEPQIWIDLELSVFPFNVHTSVRLPPGPPVFHCARSPFVVCTRQKERCKRRLPASPTPAFPKAVSCPGPAAEEASGQTDRHWWGTVPTSAAAARARGHPASAAQRDGIPSSLPGNIYYSGIMIDFHQRKQPDKISRFWLKIS